MSESNLLIDKTIRLQRYVFRCAGVNIRIEEKTRKHRYLSLMAYFFNLIWLNIDTVGEIVWLIEGIMKKKKITQLTYVTPCIIVSTLAIIKLTFTVINEATIDKLINTIRKLEIEQNEREKDPETDKIMKDEDKFLNIIIKLLYATYIFTIIGFSLNPLLLMLWSYSKTKEVELLLPFLVKYPFNPFERRYYPWVYARQVWSSCVVMLGIGTADAMFYTFCVYLGTQFRLLRFYIERVIPPESETEPLNQEEIGLKLVELIKWHQELLSSVDVLEALYTKSTLYNFVASSILICLCGFNVTAIEDIAFASIFVFFLLLSLHQTFFMCFFGNLLMESSEGISHAIYNSRWYLAPKHAMTLLVMQIRGSIPCKLTASNFAEVNLRAFMKICSTAWSYFALLQTMYQN